MTSTATLFINNQTFTLNNFTDDSMATNRITLNTGDGDDTITVTSDDALEIFVQGGDPTASDRLIVAGGGGTATLDLAAGSVTESANPVFFTGIEHVTINATAQRNVVVDATAGDDDLTFVSDGAQEGTLTASGINTQFVLNTVQSLTVNGLDGTNDRLTIRGTTAADTFTVSGTTAALAASQGVDTISGMEALTIDGREGFDTFNVTPGAIPISIDGGDPIGALPGDLLNITADGAVTLHAGPENDDGSLVDGANAPVSFDHVESISVTGGTSATVNGTNASDVITVIARDHTTHGAIPNDAMSGVRDFTVSVNAGAEILFIDTPVLTINAQAGNDQITLRTPAPNNAAWNVDVTIDGGTPSTDADRLVIETPGQDAAIYTPGATADSGTLVIDEATNDSTITLNGIEELRYDGESGNDTLTIVGTSGVDSIVYSPGDAADEGSFRVNNLLAIRFEQLGSTGAIVVDGGGNNDTLVAAGTNGNDAFTVGNNGTRNTLDITTGTLNRLDVQQINVEGLRLDGLDGDDTFTVDNNVAAYSLGVRIDGGNPSASDSVTLNGTSAGVSDTIGLALAASGDVVTGAVGGTVTLTGVERLTIDAGADNDAVSVTNFGVASALTDVTVNSGGNANDTFTLTGSSAANAIEVTPTSATSVQATAGSGPLVTVNLAAAATSTFTVDGGAGNDVVTVHGTATDDTILVNRTLRQVTVTDSLTAVYKRIDLTELAPNALVVAGGLGDDTITVTGIGGPTLTVDGQGPAASDTLVMLSTAGGAVFSATPGTANDSGSVTMDGSVTQFVGIEAVTLDAGAGVGADSVTIAGTSGDDAIAVTAISASSASVAVNARGLITIRNATAASSLTVNAGDGSDTLQMAVSGADNFDFVVNASGPAGTDRLFVEGTTGVDAFTYTPDATIAADGVIDVNGEQITFFGSEAIVLAGLGGNDTLTANVANAGAVDDRLSWTPSGDDGRFQLNSSTAVDYTSLEVRTFALGQSVVGDAIAVTGTSGNDVASIVSGTGTVGVTLNGELGTFNFDAADVDTLTIDLGAGSDAISVTPFADIAVTVHGGDAGNDTLTIVPAATATTVTETSATVSGTEQTTFTGVETLVVNGTGPLTLQGSASDDTVVISPTTRTGQINAGPAVSFPNVTALTADGQGSTNDLVRIDGSTSNDTIGVNRTASSVTLAGLAVTLAAASEHLLVAAGAGDDTINITGTGGPTSLTIDAGSHITGDTLTVTNTTAGTTTVVPGATPAVGTITTPDAPANTNFVGVEAITLTGSAASDTLVIQGTNGPDAITYGASQIRVNDRAVVTLATFGNLTLQGKEGGDTFDIDVNALALTSLTVAGNDPTTGSADLLTVRGAVAGAWTPSGVAAGSLVVDAQTITVNTIETLLFDGEGTATFTAHGTTGADTIEHTPGVLDNSGTIRVNDLLAVSYQNIASTLTSLTINGGLLADTLIVNGMTGNDTLSVPGTEDIDVNSRVRINTAGIDAYTLRGLAGNNTFNITAVAAIPVTVVGDTGSDTLNFTSTGATTLDLGGRTINDADAAKTAAPDVSYSGLEAINLIGGAQAITVAATASDDTIGVTPLTATRAQVQVNAQPLVDVTTSSTLTVDPATGNDRVTVYGTSADETIAVSQTANATITVGALKVITLATANTEGLIVAAGLGDDRIEVTGTTGPALTVDGGESSTGDRLVMISIENVADFNYAPGQANDSGALTMDTSVTQFVGIEAITLDAGLGAGANAADNVTINGTSAANQIRFAAHATNADEATVWVDARPAIALRQFTNASNVTVNGLLGDDVITVAPNKADTNFDNLTVNAGGPADADRVMVEGTSGDDTFRYTPSATNAADGRFVFGTGVNVVTIDFVGAESLALAGLGGNDSATFNTPLAGTADSVVFTPAATGDGQIRFNTSTPLSFTSIETRTIATGDAADTLTVNTSAGNDAIVVAGAAGANTITINGELTTFTHDTTAADRLIVNSGAGADSFTVTPTAGLAISLHGGNLADGDSLTFNRAADAVNLNLGTSTIQEAAVGAVDYTNIATLAMNHNGGALTIDGTSGNDTFDVAPLTATTARVQLNAASPVVTTSGGGSLTISSTGGGSDRLTVNGTDGPDTNIVVNVPGTTITVGPLKSVSYTAANIDNLVVNGRGGADTFVVTPGVEPVFIDGGDPIGMGDKLTVIAATTSILTPGPENDEGSFVVDDQQPVSFDYMEAVAVTGPATGSALAISVMGTGGDDQFTAVGKSAADVDVQVNNGLIVSYLNIAALALQGKNGDDDFDIDVNQLASIALTVDGGDPSTDGDTVTVTGNTGADAANFTPNAVDGGTLTIAGLNGTATPTANRINLLNVERLIYDGENENETLTVTSAAGAARTLTHRDGTAADAGSLQVGNWLAIEYVSLELTGSLDLNDADATDDDRLIYIGSNGDDVFGVTGAGDVQRTGHVLVNVADLAGLTLQLLSGNDAVSVAPSTLFAGGIRIEAGDSDSTGDTVTVTGRTSVNTVLDLAAATISGVVGGTIQLASVENLTINDDGAIDTIDINEVGAASMLSRVTVVGSGDERLNATGTSGNDLIQVTPTAAGAGGFVASGVQVTYRGLTDTAFTVAGGSGGFDVFEIRGDEGNNICRRFRLGDHDQWRQRHPGSGS